MIKYVAAYCTHKTMNMPSKNEKAVPSTLKARQREKLNKIEYLKDAHISKTKQFFCNILIKNS